MVRRYVRMLECLVGFVCYCSRLFAPLLFECGIFLWFEAIRWCLDDECDVTEYVKADFSFSFFPILSLNIAWLLYLDVCRCCRLLVLFTRYFFLSLFLLLYRWLNVVQLDVCWACIWANLCWFQFQFSFIDFVKYTMRLNGLIHPIFRVNSHSYVRLVWLVGWARTFAFITLQAVNIQYWKWASKCMSSISAAF